MNPSFDLSLLGTSRTAEAEQVGIELPSSLKKTVAYMLARGQFPEDIQLATGCSAQQVRLWINEPSTKALVRKIISEEKEFDPRMLARSFLPAAIQCLGEIVTNDKLHPNSRIAASKELIAMNLGRVPLGPEPKPIKNPVEEFNELQRQLSPSTTS